MNKLIALVVLAASLVFAAPAHALTEQDCLDLYEQNDLAGYFACSKELGLDDDFNRNDLLNDLVVIDRAPNLGVIGTAAEAYAFWVSPREYRKIKRADRPSRAYVKRVVGSNGKQVWKCGVRSERVYRGWKKGVKVHVVYKRQRAVRITHTR